LRSPDWSLRAFGAELLLAFGEVLLLAFGEVLLLAFGAEVPWDLGEVLCAATPAPNGWAGSFDSTRAVVGAFENTPRPIACAAADAPRAPVPRLFDAGVDARPFDVRGPNLLDEARPPVLER
jgi:hypothetical protein